MKLLLTGDWHITDKCPINRIDDYAETLYNKVKFILDLAWDEKADLILQPGDFTDSPAINYETFAKYIGLLSRAMARHSSVFVVTTYGQHDLRYRRISNTALWALEASCPRLHVLQNNESLARDPVRIYGSAYGEDLPLPSSKSACSILVTHRMVINKKLWAGQEDCEYASKFLKTHPEFDLVVSGDNHQGFISKNGNQLLVNCGALMRSTTAQLDHKPFAVIYDTETRKYEICYIPIRPSEEVFDLDKVARSKETEIDNEQVRAVIEELMQRKALDLSVQDMLLAYEKENPDTITPGAMEIIYKGMASNERN